MKLPRKVIWLVLALLVAMLVAAGLWRRAARGPALPPAANYAQLPARFAELLAAAHRAAEATPANPDAVRALAHLYQANRLEAEARACYAWLAASGGGLSPADHRLLADLSLNAGDLPGAIVELRAVTAADPTYVPARVVLAECLFKSGQEEAAATEYDAILTRAPDHPAALLGLARLALQRGDDAAAIARLERLLAVHPDAMGGAALLAQIMSRRGETERAGALTELSRSRRDPLPTDPWLDALWADCYDAQRLTLRFEELVYSGQWDDARPLLDRVAELDPGSWLPDFFRGWTFGRAHQPAEAVAGYRSALQKSGDPERILPLLVPTLVSLDRAAEAEEEVNRALQRKPDSIGLLVLQSDLVARRHGDVRPLLVALLQREPYLYKANMDLAQILWTAHEQAAAVVCLARVAKAFPSDVASRGLLGQYYLENNDPAAAVVPLEQALAQAKAGSAAREKLTAMLAGAYLKLGAAAHAADKIEEAAGWFAKAAPLAPAGLEALASLAGETVQAKQFRAASEVLARLGALQPANPTIQISLGDVLYQGGDPAAARPHWEQALKLAAPEDAALRSALTRRLNGPITPDLFE